MRPRHTPEACLDTERVIAPALLAWYGQHGRHDLPWRQTSDPYAIWLAEIMLQQTQVATALPYYHRFLERFPSLNHLAAADLDAVLHLWTGLGYYARGRNLHACALRLMQDFSGRFPQDLDTLLSLPGIGRSTAGAVLSSAFGQAQPILDGNVRRILLRYYALDADPASVDTQRQLWQWAAGQTPSAQTHAYNQAIQDLGALICRPRQPQCGHCPIQHDCLARRQDLVAVLPRVRRRAPLPQRQGWMLMIRDGSGRVLLQRQGGQGLWGGLWSLPLMPLSDYPALQELPAGILRQFGLAVRLGPIWPLLRHSFTHFHLDYTPVQLRLSQDSVLLDDALAWVEAENPGLRGLSRPAQRLLQRLCMEAHR